jgi:hypothetical protein
MLLPMGWSAVTTIHYQNGLFFLFLEIFSIQTRNNAKVNGHFISILNHSA